jgi:hypothetical protein
MGLNRTVVYTVGPVGESVRDVLIDSGMWAGSGRECSDARADGNTRRDSLYSAKAVAQRALIYDAYSMWQLLKMLREWQRTPGVDVGAGRKQLSHAC